MVNLRSKNRPKRISFLSIARMRERLRHRPQRMSKDAARLTNALNQLRDGVPLNWSQLEDDPELVTLARLYPLAREAHSQALDALPATLRDSVAERMAKRLPKAKAAVVKQAPTTLAGFSPSVQVLTQTEDDLRPSRTPHWIAATTGVGLAVMVVALFLSRFFGPQTGPFTWIELRQGTKVTLAAALPEAYKAPNCTTWQPTSDEPYTFRNYVSLNSYGDVQNDLDFPLRFLPDQIQTSTAFTATMWSTDVAPCSIMGSIPYSSARLRYYINYVSPGGSGLAVPASVFEQSKQLVTLDTTDAAWKQVKVGAIPGVIMTLDHYTDQSQVLWPDSVMLLVLEDQSVTTTIITQANDYITQDTLLKLASQLTTTPPGQQGSSPPLTAPLSTPGTPGPTLPISQDPGSSSTK